MSCHEFAEWVVGDDLTDRQRAVEHAAQCPACARVLAGQSALQDRVTLWREQSRAPAHLEDKVRRALAARALHPAGPSPDQPAPRPGRRGRAPLWLALAASFLIGIGLGVFQLPARSQGPVETRHLLAASDLRIAAAEEEAQRRVIVDLQAQAERVLERARDIDLSTHEAARLMEYRTRIANLDVTIEDVQGFVDQNPGHPRARALLLEAYREKKQILREVLALEERS